MTVASSVAMTAARSAAHATGAVVVVDTLPPELAEGTGSRTLHCRGEEGRRAGERHPCELHLIDSKPLPIAKGKRADWAKLPEASKGFSTMGMVFGFKLHALTNEQGLFERWAFATANQSDVTLAGELLEGLDKHLVLDDKHAHP